MNSQPIPFAAVLVHLVGMAIGLLVMIPVLPAHVLFAAGLFTAANLTSFWWLHKGGSDE